MTTSERDDSYTRNADSSPVSIKAAYIINWNADICSD